MFLGTFENQIEYLGQSSFGLLEKSQFLNNFLPQDQFRNARVQNNFEEIFLTNFAPNCSTISICTQEDRGYETFSIADQFFGESVDHFLDDHSPKESPQEKLAELSEQNIDKQENSLQGKNIPIIKEQMESEEAERDQEPQNCHDETKNIPKNYIKAIFTFILENEEYIERLLSVVASSESRQLHRFIEFVRQEKRIKKYTIQRMKRLWTSPQNGKAMRVISCEFLRKRSLGYIFGSKIEKKMSHIKHRYKFIRAIENPSEFTNIK